MHGSSTCAAVFPVYDSASRFIGTIVQRTHANIAVEKAHTNQVKSVDHHFVDVDFFKKLTFDFGFNDACAFKKTNSERQLILKICLLFSSRISFN